MKSRSARIIDEGQIRKMSGRINRTMWLAAFTFLLGIGLPSAVGQSVSDTSITVITDAYSDEPVLAVELVQMKIAQTKAGETIFACDEAQWLNRTGEPTIPWRVITVLLPPEVNLETVTACMKQGLFETVANKLIVPPTPPTVTWENGQMVVEWPQDKRIVDGRDADIYERDAFWPKKYVQLLGVGQLRKWRLAQVAIPLVRYNPARGKLARLTDAKVEIAFDRDNKARTTLTTMELLDQVGRGTVERIAMNFDQVCNAYDVGAALGMTLTPYGMRKPGYTIITTSDINETSSKLSDFAAHKRSLGFEVQIIREMSFGGASGDTAAENLREWLKGHYISDNIKYVLLIGNPHPTDSNIPMKMLWPRLGASSSEKSPSDYYYADLTGNWDLDGDGYYGEANGDFGPGGVDRNWEVLVGRIPYYGSVNDLDYILQKTIDYERQMGEQVEWRKNVLLPMRNINPSTFGHYLGEQIKNDILVPTGWSYHRLYVDDYGLNPPPETIPCTYDNVTNVWNNGAFGLVVWYSHGDSESASHIMDINHARDLNDVHPSFTFQASCSNAWPENTENLAYELLKNGCICTIGATRSAWAKQARTKFDGQTCIPGVAYEYSSRVVTGGLTSGEALFELKQVFATGGDFWMNYTATNIYGDPSLRIIRPLPGDLDGDGKVDLTDFAILGSQWQEEPGIPSADIEPAVGNGIIDINDLGLLLNNWLVGCQF